MPICTLTLFFLSIVTVLLVSNSRSVLLCHNSTSKQSVEAQRGNFILKTLQLWNVNHSFPEIPKFDFKHKWIINYKMMLF